MIDIVIVNWNAGKAIADCVDSITRFGSNVSKIIVVDNASTDNSLEAIEQLGSSAVIVRNASNNGFAAACNQGAKLGSAPYILFLNPDTELLNDGSLSIPLTFMESAENETVGICGIQLLDESGHISRSCSRFPTISRIASQVTGFDKFPGLKGTGSSMHEWDHKNTKEVDQVIGAFFFMRRALFEELGGFDERFFVYFEEVDLSFRAKRRGANTFYLSEARAFHAGGGTTNQVKATRLFYSLRSRLQYAKKHFSAGEALFVWLLTWAIEPFTRIGLCLLRRDWRGVRDTVSGYRMLLSGSRRKEPTA